MQSAPARRHVVASRASRRRRAVAAALVAGLLAGCNAQLRVFGPDGEIARVGAPGDIPAPPPPAPRQGGARPAAPRPAPSPAPPPRAPATAAVTGPAASEAGEVVPEPATFSSLAVRWPVRGDANANATIAVRYRKAGDEPWREGWPLFRTHPAKVSPANRVPDGWLFAGSIVDLAPDTEYEVRLVLEDPDGGGQERRLSMRTRAEPREPPGMRARHVVPTGAGGGTGTAGDPFRGLAAAQAAAAPGDLFLLHAGVYAATPWVVSTSGEPGRPIVYRAAGDGEAILDGGGGERAISAPEVRHVWFEGLTLRNARYLLVGHRGADLVVRWSTFQMSGAGTALAAIEGGYAVSRGFVISDNVFRGPATWPRSRGIEDVNGISITGAGHVVRHNLFTGLGDGIHGTSHGRLSASDIHDNDFETCTDDAIEADYSDTNVRVFRNRITNCFSGVSAQPVHGGPLYVFRNAIYNVEYSPFKLHNDTAGVLLFHNTSVSAVLPFHIDPGGETVSDVVTRNNLFVGTVGPALRSTGEMIRCDFDRDGFAWARGPFALWNGRTYASAPEAQRSEALYRRLGAVVVAAAGLFAGGAGPPASVATRYPSEINDLRLAPGSAAVGGGVALPNFSDGFAGTAPSLGCCEPGRPLPRYGPRPRPGG